MSREGRGYRSLRRAPISFVAVCLSLVAAFGAAQAPTVSAGGVGQIITVTTASDAVLTGDGCSLREAINASNDGPSVDCNGSDGLVDRIQFGLGVGVPVLSFLTPLPAITETVNLNGATGGATMVRVTGPGSGTGLEVNGTAAGTSIRGMRIDGFATGIHLKAAATVRASFIGPNTGDGIWVQSGAATIGGTNSFTPDPCSADCNIISGNGDAGIEIHSGVAGTVSGNFIGLAADGVTALPNRNGVQLNNEGWVIGGTSAGARNVISGNNEYGLWILDCAGAVTCRIQGNYIGTTASGKKRLGNGLAGILWDAGEATIGGTEAGAGNLISGNSGPGIHHRDGTQFGTLSILGNRIGVNRAGNPLGNSGAGVLIKPAFDDTVGRTVVGSTSISTARNTIAYNGRHGVETDVNSGVIQAVEVRTNSIFENGLKPFHLDAGTNFPRVPPTIGGFWPLSGTSCNSCVIDIYSDSGSEGRVYEGQATADIAGAWSFPFMLRGPHITLTATDIVHRTSEYSAAVLLPPRPDGRIKLRSGSLVGNDVYNTTGAGQARTGSAARGKTIKFTVSIQNDSRADRFKVQAAGSSTHYKVKYFRGSKDVTTAVVNGTYTTASLESGDVVAIIAKVTVKGTAPAGSSVVRLVTITSTNDPSVKDVVQFTGKRS